MQALELKVPPVALVVITAVAMWGLGAVVPHPGFSFSGAPLLAILLASAGAAIALQGVLAFRSAGTTVDPRVPNQSARLVVDGVYRFSRNPMYVGFFLALSGWGIFIGSVAALAILPFFVLYMNRFQIVPEEQNLSETFGEAYCRYSESVRRWV